MVQHNNRRHAGYALFKPLDDFKLVAGIGAILGTFMWAAFITTFARMFFKIRMTDHSSQSPRDRILWILIEHGGKMERSRLRRRRGMRYALLDPILEELVWEGSGLRCIFRYLCNNISPKSILKEKLNYLKA
jgi:hypothetical protein